MSKKVLNKCYCVIDNVWGDRVRKQRVWMMRNLHTCKVATSSLLVNNSSTRHRRRIERNLPELPSFAHWTDDDAQDAQDAYTHSHTHCHTHTHRPLTSALAHQMIFLSINECDSIR